MRSSWVGILGLTIGGIGAFFGRPQYDAWAKSKECCPTKHAPLIVFKGAGCDEMLFFSSQAGLEAWKKTQHVEGGKVFTLAEAVQHGAGIFGKFTEGLDG